MPTVQSRCPPFNGVAHPWFQFTYLLLCPRFQLSSQIISIDLPTLKFLFFSSIRVSNARISSSARSNLLRRASWLSHLGFSVFVLQSLVVSFPNSANPFFFVLFPPFPFFHVFQLSEGMLDILQVPRWQNNKDMRWVAIFIILCPRVAFE